MLRKIKQVFVKRVRKANSLAKKRHLVTLKRHFWLGRSLKISHSASDAFPRVVKRYLEMLANNPQKILSWWNSMKFSLNGKDLIFYFVSKDPPIFILEQLIK